VEFMLHGFVDKQGRALHMTYSSIHSGTTHSARPRRLRGASQRLAI
jgi:hypothetical protein